MDLIVLFNNLNWVIINILNMHFAVFIINENGSLVYDNTDLSDKIKLRSNDALRLASTFHTMHSISSEITPKSAEEEKWLAGSSLLEGIKIIETDSFKMHWYSLLHKYCLMINKKIDQDIIFLFYSKKY